MKLLALSMLLFATVGLAQLPPLSDSGRPTIDCHYKDMKQCLADLPQPKPLKCGKWEQEEQIFYTCNIKNCDLKSGTCEMDCPQPYRCIPIMHSVTEKEWQELMQRLAKLEKRQQIDGWPK